MSNEHAFINLLRGFALHPGARALADDAAVLEIGEEALVLTHDAMVEGVHFPLGQDPADIAWRLLGVNLSDLAAKGAEPLGVLLSYELGGDDTAFAQGLNEALSHYNVPLLGGDTVRAPSPRRYGMTAIGRATCRPVPARSGAKAGDLIYVTGVIGAAMLGFEELGQKQGNLTGPNIAAYLRPRPLLAEGRALAPCVTTMMDVSDGLLLDLFRMASASHVTAEIDSDKVPVASKARREECMRWGDDYQLLFTMPEGVEPPLAAHPIGRMITKGPAPLIVDSTPFSSPNTLGYTH